MVVDVIWWYKQRMLSKDPLFPDISVFLNDMLLSEPTSEMKETLLVLLEMTLSSDFSTSSFLYQTIDFRSRLNETSPPFSDLRGVFCRNERLISPCFTSPFLLLLGLLRWWREGNPCCWEGTLLLPQLTYLLLFLESLLLFSWLSTWRRVLWTFCFCQKPCGACQKPCGAFTYTFPVTWVPNWFYEVAKYPYRPCKKDQGIPVGFKSTNWFQTKPRSCEL